MKFCLHLGVLGNWPVLDISIDDFERLKKAKRGLFVLVGIEEKFEMLLDNYVDYEQELLRIALGHMVSHNVDYLEMNDGRSSMNRRLANLLTMTRLYNDQVKHDLSGLYGRESTQLASIEKRFKSESANALGYRAMEAIRNSMQHRDLPIRSIVYHSGWEDGPNGERLQHRTVVQISVEHLRGDTRFDRSVAAQLEQCGGDVHDLTPLVRQYVEGLSRVHEELRSATDDHVRSWSDAVAEALQQYSRVMERPTSRVVACRLADDGSESEKVLVFAEVIERLKRFRSRRVPTGLSRWFVTSAEGK